MFLPADCGSAPKPSTSGTQLEMGSHRWSILRPRLPAIVPGRPLCSEEVIHVLFDLLTERKHRSPAEPTAGRSPVHGRCRAGLE